MMLNILFWRLFQVYFCEQQFLFDCMVVYLHNYFTPDRLQQNYQIVVTVQIIILPRPQYY